MSGFEQLAKIATFRPLSSWPGARARKREASRFDASWSDTVELLVRELRMLKAKQTIIEIDGLAERDLRLDGLPRANARPGVGVVLSFQSTHGPLRYACDTFVAPSYRRKLEPWQHNVRAIALGLEALRKVDRYGITERGEQYRGFLALEAGDGSSTHLTYDQAVAVLRRHAKRNADEVSDLDRVIRLAKINAHPDRHGGDHSLYDEVLDAEEAVVRR